MVDFIGIIDTGIPIFEINRRLNAISTFSTMPNSTLEKFPEFAAVIAKEMGNNKVTPTQLRRFYTYVKSVEMINRDKQPNDTSIIDKYKLRFILPKIAGSSERENLQHLYEILKSCLLGNKIQTVGDLRIFVEFFEAILDYHSSLPKKSN